jgi:hypothetical protein
MDDACKHARDLTFVYLFARCGYGNLVTFTCRECGKEVTERFSPESPYRNWTTPNFGTYIVNSLGDK